ncbi:chemotaxis protein CheW [Ancylobacter oerskovii]|uniref:Chemotaxis protein CheW n=1 Tax=Ancylobacter oerskovii TaxID=459519 RepID=A0ABW4YRM6_9HYPH|nr:chemotaxis protein CheW [Ancylobacter oerskovii]MBS7545588.1 chemotaxis protein CheW [Ancylobacter oerskovii]
MSPIESLAPQALSARVAVGVQGPSPARVETTVGVLVFRLGGMRFALPSARVVNVMPLGRERFEQLARMAGKGTLGASGLPLIRLSTRLGLAETQAPARGALVLFGTEGKVRATALIDDEPVEARAEIQLMPDDWRSRFAPCAEMIGGVARLGDGRQAAMLDMTIGVFGRKAAPAAPEAHLVVRRPGHAPEAVSVACLKAIRCPGEIAGRSYLLRLGREGTPVPVEAILGLAPEGRVESAGLKRRLIADGQSYPLLEPGRTAADRAVARVLLVMRDGPARTQMQTLVRALGHHVSLADHPRALELAAGRFDVVIYDVDAYGVPAGAAPSAALCLALTGRPGRLEGFAGHLPPGDTARLIATGLGWGPRHAS